MHLGELQIMTTSERYRMDEDFRRYRLEIQKRYYQRHREERIAAQYRWLEKPNNREKARAARRGYYARQKTGGVFTTLT